TSTIDALVSMLGERLPRHIYHLLSIESEDELGGMFLLLQR
ncbi:7188_t:CDS:1, partial [Ambispora gerdemannii]